MNFEERVRIRTSDLSYAVASYHCRMAHCSRSGLVAWRSEKLQWCDAVAYLRKGNSIYATAPLDAGMVV